MTLILPWKEGKMNSYFVWFVTYPVPFRNRKLVVFSIGISYNRPVIKFFEGILYDRTSCQQKF